jgi:hypothetical protein
VDHTDNGYLRTFFLGLVVASILLTSLIALSGCGGSSSSGLSEAQIVAAKRQGEEAAHEKDRINSLRKQVHALQHQAKHGGQTVVVEHTSGTTPTPQDDGSTVLRTFHAPSGNVSCEILPDGALCTVGSIDTTFFFSGGKSAHIESGAVLSDGAGELASYGTTITEGSITCMIPQSDEPRGITCTDADSGHGFEASRVSARQHAY